MTDAPAPGAERVVGWVRGEVPGPLLLCVGGLHGNESAGVDAMGAVVRQISARKDRLRGDFLAVRGNVGALASGRRFLSYDLNRAWTKDRLTAGAAVDPTTEDAEVAGLGEILGRAVREARGELFMLDLHTTSGDGGAFTTVGDSLENRAFARAIPVPLVLGLEELVEGTLVGYASELGFTTAVFECGQHREPEAAGRAEAAIWIAVEAAGLLEPEGVPEASRGKRSLAAEHKGLPPVLEMRYRHHVESGDGYATRPGYENFQPVTPGEAIGRDSEGEVVVPEKGRVLMPLYQEQGEDGFFVVREFSRFWLMASKVLRRMGVARVVHWLPGVHREPGIPGALAADKRVARWFALELFHLLGYRRHLEEESRLVVISRRARRVL
ncbi:MAG: succinylglutamate desuccinylase/aspartoacylase family protein [Longimicrobiales bacterium]